MASRIGNRTDHQTSEGTVEKIVLILTIVASTRIRWVVESIPELHASSFRSISSEEEASILHIFRYMINA